MLQPDGVATLPMYDFVELGAAHDALWSAVVEAYGPGLPPTLDHGDDVHALWHAGDLAVSQACGWPLVDELDGRVRTIGAFAYDVDTAGPGATYASHVLVGPHHDRDQPPTEMTAAVNSSASLSGWLSLVRAFPELDGTWPGGVVVTGAHVDSLAALQAGTVDIAAIDAVTFALVRRFRPALVDGLVTLAEGPLIPCVPLIAHADTTDDELARLREAFTAAMATVERRHLDDLLITGFHPLDRTAYDPVREMAVVWQGGRP